MNARCMRSPCPKYGGPNIAVWSELTRQAAAIHDTRGDRQEMLDF